MLKMNVSRPDISILDGLDTSCSVHYNFGLDTSCSVHNNRLTRIVCKYFKTKESEATTRITTRCRF